MIGDFIGGEIFAAARVAHFHNPAAVIQMPPAVADSLPAAMLEEAAHEIAQWDGYKPTPLFALPGLAALCGIGAAHYKDESARFGLGSFKALGGAYALLRALSDKFTAAPADVRAGKLRARAAEMTAVAATDGNHGRAVAWGAQQFGCRCEIYIHAEVSENRAAAMRNFGAEIIRVDGDYDESIRQARIRAEHPNRILISDFADADDDITTRRVMAGYATLSAEARAQLTAWLTHESAKARAQLPELPTHVFVPAGVGGLAAALIADFWHADSHSRPRFIIVESDFAAGLFHSAKNGSPTVVPIERETIMAGLSCGEVSAPAWPFIKHGADDFVAITDDGVAPAMRMAASGIGGDPAVTAGECAVAGWAVLATAACQPPLFDALGLGRDSRVLLIGSEGATDPDIYRRLVGAP